MDNNKTDNNQNSLDDENKDKQTLFRLFNIEITAPQELKNPRIIYIAFIFINFIILILLKKLTTN